MTVNRRSFLKGMAAVPLFRWILTFAILGCIAGIFYLGVMYPLAFAVMILIGFSAMIIAVIKPAVDEACRRFTK